ncbi:MAG: hypothetical protein ACE5H4_07345 [Candidatus Thorarchaeota archaeon]
MLITFRYGIERVSETTLRIEWVTVQVLTDRKELSPESPSGLVPDSDLLWILECFESRLKRRLITGGNITLTLNK